jgi:septation ring formation regulator EzrA
VGIILVIVITIIVVVVVRRTYSSKVENEEKEKIAHLNARLLDDDGEVDAFYSNRCDFVA